MKPLLFCSLLLSASLHAEDTYKELRLANRDLLRDVVVKDVTSQGLKVTHRDGGGIIKLEKLDPKIRAKYETMVNALAEAEAKKREDEGDAKAAGLRRVAANAAAAATPDKPGKAFPGLKPVDVYLNMEKEGFQTKKLLATEQCEWTSTRSGQGAEMSATAIGPDTGSVTLITGTCVNLADATSTKAAAMLGYLASVPYTGADPAQAKEWVKDNINTDNARITIGGASFHIMARASTPRVRMLRIVYPN